METIVINVGAELPPRVPVFDYVLALREDTVVQCGGDGGLVLNLKEERCEGGLDLVQAQVVCGGNVAEVLPELASGRTVDLWRDGPTQGCYTLKLVA